jgi:hypothetical protein
MTLAEFSDEDLKDIQIALECKIYELQRIQREEKGLPEIQRMINLHKKFKGLQTHGKRD